MGQKGLIGMVLAQSPEFVAPHGAKEAVFGTNPIAISIPSKVGAGGSGGVSKKAIFRINALLKGGRKGWVGATLQLVHQAGHFWAHQLVGCHTLCRGGRALLGVPSGALDLG